MPKVCVNFSKMTVVSKTATLQYEQEYVGIPTVDTGRREARKRGLSVCLSYAGLI